MTDELDQVLRVLGKTADIELVLDQDPQDLPQLIAQCSAQVELQNGPSPVRMVHHLACSGGTLFAKLLAATPNTMLLNEIDPLSRLNLKLENGPLFAPTDLIYGMRVAFRSGDDSLAIRVFKAGLQALHAGIGEIGQQLVLRDHSHSHFCTDLSIDDRPTLREIVAESLPVRSVVTVRHPLDSFLSLDNNGWRHFKPFTLENYASRYLRFLDRHAGLPIIRYETLLDTPKETLRLMCELLELPFSENVEVYLPIIRLSGDSGRSGTRIGPRPRRAIPDWIAAQLEDSPAYTALCTRLEYDRQD